MSDAAEALPDFDYVEADLHYIVNNGRPSIRHVDWPEMQHADQLPDYEPHRVQIANGRRAAAREPFALATHGFRLVDHPTAVRDFFDETEVLSVYYREIEDLIARESGARRVVVFDHTVRTADSAFHTDRWIRNTVRTVHNDYTERSAPKRVREVLPDEADALLQRRFGIIQVWRTIADKVESQPLALCDGRSIPEIGFVSNQRRYRDRTAETYHITHHPDHRWYYFPEMTRDEAIVFKVFDSDASAGTRFTAHTGFDDPTTKPGAAPRQSIEMRALVFY